MEIFGDFEQWSLAAKVYFALSLFATLTLVVQIMLLAFGFGDTGDLDMGGTLDTSVDVDIEGDHDLSGVAGITYFSVSSITAFLCFFGWVGFLGTRSGMWGLPVFVMAFGCGAAALFMVAWLLSLFRRLTATGNERLSSAIGETGTVYLGIPEGRNAVGHVTVTVSGRQRECQAVSEDGQAIGTRERIRVTGQLDPRTLIVAPLNPAADWSEKGM